LHRRLRVEVDGGACAPALKEIAVQVPLNSEAIGAA